MAFPSRFLAVTALQLNMSVEEEKWAIESIGSHNKEPICSESIAQVEDPFSHTNHICNKLRIAKSSLRSSWLILEEVLIIWQEIRVMLKLNVVASKWQIVDRKQVVSVAPT